MVNSGTIAATYSGGPGAGVGVALSAGGSVTNATLASISGSDNGVEIAGGAGTVVNSGTISGTVGVLLHAGGSVTNAASASIRGGNFGVSINGGAGTVVNSGTISAGGYGVGILLVAGGSVTNAASASITGRYDGVQIISGTGTVVNSGTISATHPAGIGVYLYAGGTVTNAGTITGSIAAVEFAGTASNLLVVDPGAVFNGGVIGGTYASNALELASGGGTGTLSGLGTNFINFETVTVDSGASWVLTGSSTVSDGQTLVDDGTLSGNVVVSSGGVLEVAAGGTAIGATVQRRHGACRGWGIAIGTMVGSGGTLELFGDASNSATTINAGSILKIGSGYILNVSAGQVTNDVTGGE